MFLYENKPGGALFPITIIAYLLKNATVFGGSAWLKYYEILYQGGMACLQEHHR